MPCGPTPPEFVEKWKPIELCERAPSQEHFIDLCNGRRTWLRLAHDKPDRAALATYAAVDPEGEWPEEWAEVWTETGAGQPLPEDHELCERRLEIDQKVLANLLRMNLDRAMKDNE